MKMQLCLILAAGLSFCANWETASGPYVNEPAIQQGIDTLQRASAYESQGDSPGDSWERAQTYNGFGNPFGMMGSGMVSRLRIIHELIEAGASTTAVPAEYKSLIGYARDRGWPEIVEILENPPHSKSRKP
jgi:hypothetical protein